MKTLDQLFAFELFHIGNYKIHISNVALLLVVFLATKIILWVIRQALDRRTRLNDLDPGSTYALFQIIRYLLWIVAIGVMLESVGIKLTLVLAGSAALLVGVGLGLQQTFNDIISGIILLGERSIKIGDVLEIDQDVVQIQSIGLRTSKGLNRDEISIILPNSLITTSKVINWSHQSDKTRFRIDVGVAYGSDVDKVIRILEESAKEHPDVSNPELIEGRLVNFGNSSLDFQLLFFSKNIFRINKVRSDIRRIIDRKFRENNITIPFPQMDLHVKSGLPKKAD